jgi:hypothetical protein
MSNIIKKNNKKKLTFLGNGITVALATAVVVEIRVRGGSRNNQSK